MEYLLVIITMLGNDKIYTERFATKQECIFMGNTIKKTYTDMTKTDYSLRPDLFSSKCYLIKKLK